MSCETFASREARLRFSEHFGTTLDPEADDFFDPLLNLDTPLFIDPFLIQTQECAEFLGAHDELVAFFQDMFERAAAFHTPQQLGTVSGTLFRSSLRFPEFEETCLGLTAAGTRGLGSGAATALAIARGLVAAVSAGLQDPSHFEEIGILADGIGPDRISDAVSNILRHRFASYTERICNSKRIELRTFHHPAGRYDPNRHQWVPLEMRLPFNPYNRKGIVLVPHRYLRRFPTINAKDFWDYSYDNEIAILRVRFGAEISRSVNKLRIIDLARNSPGILGRYIDHASRAGPQPYDLVADPDVVRRWYDDTKPFVSAFPLTLRGNTRGDFNESVERMLRSFQHFIEQNGGWQLITDENGELRLEAISQRTLLGVVLHQCKMNDIDVSPEANIGRGPVDFKFSRGSNFKVLTEVKLARNTKFWHGLREQLPTYLKAEDRRDGWFVVVAQRHELERIREIRAIVQEVNRARHLNIKILVVSADRPPSASNVPPGNGLSDPFGDT